MVTLPPVVVIAPVVTPPLVSAPVVAPSMAGPVLTALVAEPRGWNLAVSHGGVQMPVAERLEELQALVLGPVDVAEAVAAAVKPVPLPVYPRKQDRN